MSEVYVGAKLEREELKSARLCALERDMILFFLFATRVIIYLDLDWISLYRCYKRV